MKTKVIPKENYFAFNTTKIIEYAKGLKPKDERNYLIAAIAEYERINVHHDPEAGIGGPKFKERIKKRLDEIELKVGKETPTRKKTPESMWWTGSEAQLIYFFDLLVANNLLHPTQADNRYSIIAAHFKNTEGKQFNNRQLYQTQKNMDNSKNGRKPKQKDALIVENIAKKIAAKKG